MNEFQQRIVSLQRQLKLARQALEGIKGGYRNPEGLASDALDALWRMEKKQPLQKLLGHEAHSR